MKKTLITILSAGVLALAAAGCGVEFQVLPVPKIRPYNPGSDDSSFKLRRIESVEKQYAPSYHHSSVCK